MHDYIHLTTPIEINDFLISIMTAFSNQIEQRYSASPGSRGYLERIADFLTKEVILDNTAFKLGSVDIKASLKDDPTFKQRLQQSLKGHTAKMVKDAHVFAQDAVNLIAQKNKDQNKKVVLLVDSVEQIRGVGADGSVTVHRSVENLFSAHAASLQIPMVHIVYTIPPYLTALAPGLGRQLGGAMVCTLPSIHVQKKDNSTDTVGLEIMRELISKRYQYWDQVFTVEQINTLATASGGDLRDFFRLVRAALVKTGNVMPVEDGCITHTLNHLRREMLPIASDDKKWLQKITRNKKTNLETIDDLPDLARFFDTNLVLNYRNGDDWYDVHPLLISEITD